MPEYKVQLDVYNGPLDLLLYLIRRDEIDIYDIPIARITEQYCRFCETLQRIDPDMAGEFLVMAATLMEIKSRTLLPRPPAETADDADLSDPRLELVRQLLEYKRIKDASLEMARQAADHARRFPRGASPQAASRPGEVDLEDVQLWDLVAAFGQLLAATGRGPLAHEVVFDDTPISLHATDIIDRLSREGPLTLQAIFEGRSRGEMIGLFLALLELVRGARVRALQRDAFGPIELVLLSAAPIELDDEWNRPRASAPSDAPAPEPAPADGELAGAGGGDLRLVQDEEDELESFAELEAIQVDVDIDLSGNTGDAGQKLGADQPDS